MTNGAEETRRGSRRRSSIVARAVVVAISAILVLDAWEALRAAVRRGGRRFTGWEDGFERREQRRLHEYEIGVLARRLRPGR